MRSSGRAALALLLAAFVARQVYARHGGCESGYLPAPGCYTDGEWSYHKSGDVTRIKTACTEVTSAGKPWCMKPAYQVCSVSLTASSDATRSLLSDKRAAAALRLPDG